MLVVRRALMRGSYRPHLLFSTFVSKYNDIGAEEVRSYLESMPDIEIRERHDQIIIRDCSVLPEGFCLKPSGLEKSDNQWKVYFKSTGGVWFCHRCGSTGSWYDLKRLQNGGSISRGLRAIDIESSASATASRPQLRGAHDGRGKVELRLPDQVAVSHYAVTFAANPQGAPEVDDIRHYLTKQRGLKMEVLVKYGVGCATYRFPEGNTYVNAPCVTFPWVMTQADMKQQDLDLGTVSPDTLGDATWITRRVKARAYRRKDWQRLDPSGGGWGLFGLHTVPEGTKDIVLTEGEYDAMAVFQGTGLPAVSLPNGASSLPIDVLPLLERFDRIYLWMDNDAAGQAGCEKFAKKLGASRCYIVRPNMVDLEKCPGKTLKDANEALLAGADMKAMIERAERPEHTQIATFKHLRDQVLHEIQFPDEYNGTPINTLPGLTKIIKGVRKGEMNLVTGGTGSGKTTLLSQISLDMAQQGVNTLWGSFEIKNTKLLKKMLQQYHGKPLHEPGCKGVVIEGIEAVADRFQSLPLYFMTFHGGSEVDQVIDTMDFAVYAYDVEHIIVDNLQFMLSRVGRKNGAGAFGDRFDQQDLAIEKFRRFATDKNVHVTVVVHPRKEDEGVRLGLSSIFGSAKATQEADAVIILQNDGIVKYLDVRKNRFDGDLGVVPLNFSAHTTSFYEDEELMANVSAIKSAGSASSSNQLR